MYILGLAAAFAASAFASATALAFVPSDLPGGSALAGAFCCNGCEGDGAMLVWPTVAIERACVSAASCADFSLICFCFSSSLARMSTRSSGMGLLSCGEQG